MLRARARAARTLSGLILVRDNNRIVSRDTVGSDFAGIDSYGGGREGGKRGREVGEEG